MEEKVRAVLDEIRPFLKADGGDAELIDVSPEGIVRIRLVGACGHCPMSTMTTEDGDRKETEGESTGGKGSDGRASRRRQLHKKG